jgi:hypothetical protein
MLHLYPLELVRTTYGNGHSAGGPAALALVKWGELAPQYATPNPGTQVGAAGAARRLISVY